MEPISRAGALGRPFSWRTLTFSPLPSLKALRACAARETRSFQARRRFLDRRDYSAKVASRRRAGTWLTSFELKTILQFQLLGDPTL